MGDSVPDGAPRSSHPGRFITTHWSLVAAAGELGKPKALEAMAILCELYWYPLYAFVRRNGYDADQARDITQGFFVRLIEKNNLATADPQHGRFRTWLLAAMKHYLSNERDRALAQKTGAGRLVSIDATDAENRYRLEPWHDITPEKIFNRRWARTLLEHVLTILGQECNRDGKGPLFDSLKEFIAGGSDDRSYQQIAESLQMTPGAIKVAVHRLRARYRELLREQISQTVDGESEIDNEINDLFASLQ
jgi:RNA polymerase sigma-70 factor (ECF subfamily)